MAARAMDTARLARVLGLSMAEVRQMTYRDLAGMAAVLGDEQRERQRAQKRQAAARSARPTIRRVRRR